MHPSEARDARAVLLLDGDGIESRRIAGFLAGYGFRVIAEPRRSHAAQRISALDPDLVIIAASARDAEGLTACRAVRPLYRGPILMLTARGGEIDEVAGLEAGADDYLTNPVHPRLLLAHVRALLRRRGRRPVNAPVWDGIGSAARPAVGPGRPDTLKAGALTVLVGSRTILLDGAAVPLTSAEFELLWLLARHAGQVMSRNQIRRSLCGRDHDDFDRSIDLRIHKIRRKLGDDPKTPRIIKSVRGVGYLLMI